MKTIQLMNHRFVTFLVAFVLLFASCDNPIFDPGGEGNGGGKPKDPPSTDCSIKGTMVRVLCASGIYGDLWIKTDNGKYLQPCEQSFMTTVSIELKEGDRVEFGYAKQGKSSCDNDKIRCLAALPEHQSISLSCIRVIDTKPIGDCPSLVVDHTNYPENVIQVLESKMDGNLLKLKVGYSGCSQVDNEDFLLSWKGEIQESYPARALLQLSSPFITDGITCQAYFTNDLCFDVAAITKLNQGAIYLNIGTDNILVK